MHESSQTVEVDGRYWNVSGVDGRVLEGPFPDLQTAVGSARARSDAYGRMLGIGGTNRAREAPPDVGQPPLSPYRPIDPGPMTPMTPPLPYRPTNPGQMIPLDPPMPSRPVDPGGMIPDFPAAPITPQELQNHMLNEWMNDQADKLGWHGEPT